MKIFRLLLILAALVGSALAQTTYTEVLATNNRCFINECTLGESQFSPAATMTYSNSIRTYGNQSFVGSITFNGNSYSDFAGTFTWLGYQNHYPFGTWELRGTFNGGLSVVTEDWWCFRTCGGAHSGNVEDWWKQATETIDEVTDDE